MEIPAGPKGTRDFYPEDMLFQEFIFSSWHKTCRRYGFEAVDGPMFEALPVYTAKSGDEIEKQLYTFEDKGGRMMALRPEMTPTVARMVAARGSMLKRPVRWYSIPRLFRYERMQKGRLREFYQLNMDILGIEDVLADAELIAASIDMMRDLGLTANDFTVHVSSRHLLEQLFTSVGVAPEALPLLYAALDKKHKVPAEEFEREVAVAVPDSTVRARVVAALSAQSLEEVERVAPNLPAAGDLRTLLAHLETFGMRDYASFDIGIVRGLAYYTGIVFELLDKQRTLRAIAGGGRYNHLVKAYGGQDTPAVGFAAGDVVLAELLRDKGIGPAAQPRSQVFVAALDDAYPGKTIEMAQSLRGAGISAEFPLKPTGLGKQFKQADACGALLTIIIGGDEEKQDCAKIKDMKAGGEMLTKKADVVAEVLRRLRA
jgi:histidyl-tRNA synthetase